MYEDLQTYTCSHCKFETVNNFFMAYSYYLIQGIEIPLYAQLAWCFKCEGISIKENFENTLEYSDELVELEFELASLLKNENKKIFKKESEEVERKQAQIREKKLQLAINSRRHDTERCLICSSFDVMKFDYDYTIYELASLAEDGESYMTGIHHPGCGGEFIFTQIKNFVHISPGTNHFSLEGIMLENIARKKTKFGEILNSDYINALREIDEFKFNQETLEVIENTPSHFRLTENGVVGCGGRKPSLEEAIRDGLISKGSKMTIWLPGEKEELEILQKGLNFLIEDLAQNFTGEAKSQISDIKSDIKSFENPERYHELNKLLDNIKGLLIAGKYTSDHGIELVNYKRSILEKL